MKNYILLLFVFVTLTINSQEGKDKNGIRLDAPKGVHQYAFRIGIWNETSKSLISRDEWKTNTSGAHRVYVAENGLTFIEEGLDEKGNITHKITFDYVEVTDSWENNYIDLKTSRKVKYTSKIIDGNMVETIIRKGNTNNNTYTVLADNIYIYTARRTFGNGFTIVNHVGISTKKKI